MHRVFAPALLFASLLVTSSLAADGMPFTAEDLRHFNVISTGVGRAPEFILYEGLPHQTAESELLKKELATKQTVRLHGYPFYARPLPVAAEDIDKLRRLCSSADSFWTYSGAKFCGGFHPDYCLVWKDGKVTYEFLICFGCHEMMLCHPKKEHMADIRNEAYEQFKTILTKYHAQRPQTQ